MQDKCFSDQFLIPKLIESLMHIECYLKCNKLTKLLQLKHNLK